jgi:hypothetical protein
VPTICFFSNRNSWDSTVLKHLTIISAIFATPPDGGNHTGRPWQGRHNSTEPIESYPAGLPPSLREGLRKFHFPLCGSRQFSYHTEFQGHVDRSGSLIRPGGVPYVLPHSFLYLCHCIFSFQGSEEGHRNVPSLTSSQKARILMVHHGIFQKNIHCL